MIRTAIIATASVFALASTTTMLAPPANAGIEEVLDTLEEFDDIAECDYVVKRVRVKVRTSSGYKWVWMKRRIRECDDD